MSTLTPEQLARLPKYAREAIDRLESQLAAARQDAEALQESRFQSPGSDMAVRVRYALTGGQDLDLHSRALVEFDVEGGRVAVAIRRGLLHVSSSDGGIIIKPSSSNVAEISVDKF